MAKLGRWERQVDRPFDNRRDLEVKNLVQVAGCVTEAALWRENSLGAHYRADFPQRTREGRTVHSRLVRKPEERAASAETSVRVG